MLAKRLAGKTFLVMSFVTKGVHCKDQIEEPFVVMDEFFAFSPKCKIFNILVILIF